MEISKDWKSTIGTALKESFTKDFIVAANDREKPKPENWQITSPKSESVDQLTIDFGESIDFLLAMNAVTVTKNDIEISGQISLNDDESVWSFIPNEPWDKSEYQIVVESRLEDIAGNNLTRPFDRDITKEEAGVSELMIISFIPRSQN